jgi:hypothetical protein
MVALGFRFDCEGVIHDGVAHRADCPLVPATLPAGAVLVLTGGVYRSEWCPRVCACAPHFETLLGHEVELSHQRQDGPSNSGS